MRINVTIDTSPQYIITLEEVERIAKEAGRETVPDSFSKDPHSISKDFNASWCADLTKFLRYNNIDYIRVIAT